MSSTWDRSSVLIVIPVPLTIARALLPENHLLLPLEYLPSWIATLNPICRDRKDVPVWPLLLEAGRQTSYASADASSSSAGCLSFLFGHDQNVEQSLARLLIPGVDGKKDGRTPFLYTQIEVVDKLRTSLLKTINAKQCSFQPSDAPYQSTSQLTHTLSARTTQSLFELEFVESARPPAVDPARLIKDLQDMSSLPIVGPKGSSCIKQTRNYEARNEKSKPSRPIAATLKIGASLLPNDLEEFASKMVGTSTGLLGIVSQGCQVTEHRHKIYE